MSSSRQPRSRPQRKRGGRSNSQSLQASQPNAYDSNPVISRKFRFQASAAFNGLISGGCLLNLLATTTTTTTAIGIIGAIRLSRVETWGAFNTGAVAGSEAVLTTLGQRSRPTKAEDVGTVQMPAHLVWRPPPQSQQAQWLNVSDTAAAIQFPFFNLKVDASAIIDIHVQFMLQDTAVLTDRPLTVVAAVAGKLYRNFLDNTAANAATVGTGLLAPLGGVSSILLFG